MLLGSISALTWQFPLLSVLAENQCSFFQIHWTEGEFQLRSGELHVSLSIPCPWLPRSRPRVNASRLMDWFCGCVPVVSACHNLQSWYYLDLYRFAYTPALSTGTHPISEQRVGPRTDLRLRKEYPLRMDADKTSRLEINPALETVDLPNFHLIKQLFYLCCIYKDRL